MRATNINMRATNINMRATNINMRATNINMRATNINMRATNINMRWLLQQIPTGWQLEHIVAAGAGDLFGVLCLQGSDAAPQQQQQQQQTQPVPWMAAVWDGAAWHVVGMYSSEQQARNGCVYVLDMGPAAAASSCVAATPGAWDNLGSSEW
jgi:hypothetical protein